jgi:hypothetical protein
MGRRDRQDTQEPLWIAHTDFPRTVAHPFYEQVNRLLERHEFDGFVERECTRYYAAKMGRPSLAPGGAAETERQAVWNWASLPPIGGRQVLQEEM